MLFIPVYAFADLGNVCKDGLLVAFAETLWWRDLVAPASKSTAHGFGMVGM